MTERPILFSAEMVRAILDGRKTQTRRKMKVQPTGHHWEMLPGYQLKHAEAVMANGKVAVMFRHTIPQNPSPSFESAWILCPYGAPGDTLWVRETWAPHPHGVMRCGAVYRADPDAVPDAGRWRPSIHMPRWASRITLSITDIRVERLQDIEGQHPSESDAIAEGVRAIHHGDGDYYYSAFRDVPHPKNWSDPADAFREVWNTINGPGAWDDNPWVWVISFERVKP